MKLILDTNVFVSGIFWNGPPHEILKLWRDGKITLVLSQDILKEYTRVIDDLSRKYPEIDVSGIINLLIQKAQIANVPPLKENVCEDPDDDMFLACAIHQKAKLIVSGDKLLLKTSGYQGIEVITAKKFIDTF